MSRKDIIIVITMFTLLSSLFFGCNQTEKPDYEKEFLENVSIVRIVDTPNVREEAILHDREDNNSLGNVLRNGFTIQVNGIYKANIDVNNGVYYGFKIEDLKAQPEGEWFPKIEKDADGVVWINHRYVQILF